MTPDHQAHLERLIVAVTADLTRKYEAGQQEHGGNLWQKAGLLDHAIQEILDLVVYLYTLREQLQRLAGPAQD